jgi:hypothetical protein
VKIAFCGDIMLAAEVGAAVQWRELLDLSRRPKWRYVPLGVSWLAARLKKAVLGA